MEGIKYDAEKMARSIKRFDCTILSHLEKRKVVADALDHQKNLRKIYNKEVRKHEDNGEICK